MSGVHRSGQPGQPDYRLTLYPSVFRLVLVALGGLGFTVAGVFLCVSGGGPALIAGIAAVLFFGACFLYAALRLIVRKPVLVLDNAGLHDNASALSAGFLAWSEIDSVGVVNPNQRRQRMLVVSVTDPQALLARMSPAKGRAMQGNIKLNGAPVNIPQVFMPINLNELEREIQAARQVLGR